MGHGEAAGRDEAVGGGGREPELVAPALGGQAAGDDGERALGVGLARRFREGEVHAQPVVPARVDEGRRDPHHRIVGPQLHVGVDGDPLLSHPLLRGAVDVIRPDVGGGDAGPGPHRAALAHRTVTDSGVSTTESRCGGE